MADLMIQKLRNNEYFGLQTTFDNLYNESKSGRYFTDLYDLIVSEENILLAFRNLKSNTGSKTKGTGCYKASASEAKKKSYSTKSDEF